MIFAFVYLLAWIAGRAFAIGVHQQMQIQQEQSEQGPSVQQFYQAPNKEKDT